MRSRELLIASLLLGQLSCAGGDADETTPRTADEATTPEQTEETTAPASGRIVHTQDVWALFSVSAVDPSGDTIELLDRIMEEAEVLTGPPISLNGGFVLRESHSLHGSVTDPAGSPLPHISVSYSLLSRGDTVLLLGMTTPDIGRRFANVAARDLLTMELPLSFFPSSAPKVLAALAFAQGLPSADPNAEIGLTDGQILARRWNSGDFRILGEGGPNGQSLVVFFAEGTVLLPAREARTPSPNAIRFASSELQAGGSVTLQVPAKDYLVTGTLDATPIVVPAVLGTCAFGAPALRVLHRKGVMGCLLWGIAMTYVGYRGDAAGRERQRALQNNVPAPDGDECAPGGPPLGPPSGGVSGTLMPDGSFVPSPPPPDSPPPPPGCPPPPPGNGPGPGSGGSPGAGPGGASGEPHMRFLDGDWYDLQAAGEFIALEDDSGRSIIQMRSEPWGPNARAAATTAVAMDVAGTRVTIVATDSVPVRIDGEPTSLRTALFTPLPTGGGFISRYLHRIAVVWPDGTGVRVNLKGRYLDFHIWTPAEMAGRVAGLLGNADGEGGNDFVTRGGRVLSNPPDFETLYGTFAESWRVSPGESLFDYPEGESTETFTDREFPRDNITLADLPDADVERARQICRDAGISESPALEQCLYDVGLTGDPIFASSAQVVQTFISPSADALLAPAEVPATSPFQVSWPGDLGEASRANRITLVPAAAEDDYAGEVDVAWDWHLTLEGNPIEFWSPVEPGAYELRYWDGETPLVVARRPIRVLTGVSATIDAPATVAAGSTFTVTWSGPAPGLDGIVMLEAGVDPERTTPPYVAVGLTRDGNPLELTAPAEPGEYELRYLYGGGTRARMGFGNALLRVPIRVN